MTNTIQNLIEVISCFEGNNKIYWISKLNTCDSNKGLLLMYFNLL